MRAGAKAPGAAGALRKSSFAPVAAPDARLLVLGSLPGEASLARSEYYAHPQNQFWRLMGDALGRDLRSLGYGERLRALGEEGVALWDVVAEASREGSLDSNIKGHVANDLAALAASLPALRAVAFNGGSASRLGRRLLSGAAGLELLDLPSSSPAYTLGYADKLAAWSALGGWARPRGGA